MIYCPKMKQAMPEGNLASDKAVSGDNRKDKALKMRFILYCEE
jgi:hypothetical protein